MYRDRLLLFNSCPIQQVYHLTGHLSSYKDSSLDLRGGGMMRRGVINLRRDLPVTPAVAQAGP